MIMSGELQEARVEVDGITATLEYHAAKIIGGQVPGCAAPIVKGMNVAEKEILERLVQKELEPQSPAVGEGEDEAGQTAAGVPEGDFAEVGPVGLALLTGKSSQAEEGLTAGWADVCHHAAQLSDTSLIAPGADHFELLKVLPLSDGCYAENGLVQLTSGTIYGLAYGGGAQSYGTAFSLSVGLGPFDSTVPAGAGVGAAVKILGTNLKGATSVTFNDIAATFTVESATAIKTTVPTGATTGLVRVVTPSGTLTSNVNFQVLP